MKTKNLFLATALVASFAACTNEEIVDMQQHNIANSRPTVDNVELNFGVNAESRVAYMDGKWQWNSTDIIGALLMDVIKNPGSYDVKDEWHEKYQLSPYVQTSYPFTYKEGVWSCDTKMLEGNYFFAYPWSSYDGERQVKHSLINQEQTGVTADVRAKAYADNNLFIGYQQIVAGTQAADVLENVEMWGVLGAIQLQIKNTGTQDRHINKVVLSGTNLKSTLTFDPHTAYNYAPTNANATLWENDFNYANYFGWEEDPIFVKTAKENKYDREKAILGVVTTVSNPEVDGFAQVVINGTKEERALIADAGNTAYVMIMVNPMTAAQVKDGGLKLSIYTDEGVVSDVTLTTVHTAASDYKVITSAKVKEVGPSVKNTIAVQIDDNSFIVPEKMEVFNTNDLEQLLAWNAATPGARDVVATLNKDVKFTAEMFEVLEGKANMTLKVMYPEARAAVANSLILAEDLPVDVLESEQLTIATNIKVEGEIELTKDIKSTSINTIEVLEGAELIINDAKAKLPTTSIINNGTLTIGEKANINKNVTISNYGDMDVAEAAIVKTATVNNYGILNVDGRVDNIATNGTSTVNKEVKITLGTEGLITVTNNYATVKSEGDLKVTNNYGKVYYEDGDLNVSNKTNGETYANLPAKVNKAALKDLGSVNVWVAAGDVKFDDAVNATTLANVLVEESADITVAETAKTVTITTLKVEGVASVEEGEITIGTINVTENGVLTIEEDAIVNGDDIANAGLIDIDGILYAEGTLSGEGDIRGDISEYPAETPADKTKQDVMNTAVAAWMKHMKTWTGTNFTTYYDYELTIEKFIALMKEWSTASHDGGDAAKAFTTAKANATATTALWGVDYTKPAADAASIESKLMPNGVACTEFTTALASELSAEEAIFDKTWTTQYVGALNLAANATLSYDLFKVNNEVVVFESKTEALNVVRKFMATPGNIKTDYPGQTSANVTTWNALNQNELFAAAWLKTDSEIETVLAETEINGYIGSTASEITANYLYVYEGCGLHEVMQLIATKDASQWNVTLFGSTTNATEAGCALSGDLNTMAQMKAWMKAVYNSTAATSLPKEAAVAVYNKYKAEYEKWQYTDVHAAICAE